ncbi:hypothetical protein QUA86_23820 [Microcoleus sp. F6_B6]
MKFIPWELRAYIQNTAASKFTATHAMLSVPASIEQIEQIADREDSFVQRASFGFDFLMLWVENRLLLELLTPEMTENLKGGTRHVIYPWNQSKIANRKSSRKSIYLAQVNLKSKI